MFNLTNIILASQTDQTQISDEVFVITRLIIAALVAFVFIYVVLVVKVRKVMASGIFFKSRCKAH